MMRKYIPLALVGLAALGGVGCATMSDTHKVAYHINSDDQKTLKGALGNMQNHINAVGKENLDMRVVMHGNGLALLQIAKENPDFKAKVDNLKLQGVKFNVCANTIKGRKIDKATLYDMADSDIVPSGVAEIAILQKKGYAYVKP